MKWMDLRDSPSVDDGRKKSQRNKKNKCRSKWVHLIMSAGVMPLWEAEQGCLTVSSHLHSKEAEEKWQHEHGWE